jgi:hypothetical protein
VRSELNQSYVTEEMVLSNIFLADFQGNRK